MIAPIILAAGQSTRMGRLKQLLPFGEGSILQQVVDHALAADVGPVVGR